MSNRESLIAAITESHRLAVESKKEYALYGNKLVYVNNPLPDGFDLQYVLSTVEDRVPRLFAHEVDYVMIGQNEEMNAREINAMFKDGAIYVTNDQKNEEDMLDDIVHEIAHSAEKMFGAEIYGDSEIEVEFLGKRKRLLDLLKAEYGEDIRGMAKKFLEVDYSKEFDEFLYKAIGYPKLTMMTLGLFVSPYGITSLREYFANGFEEYFLGDIGYVRKISPKVYLKINELINSDTIES